jgi:hypothetical protein
MIGRKLIGYEYVITKVFSVTYISESHPDYDCKIVHGGKPFSTPEEAIAAGTEALKEIEKKEFRWTFAGKPATVTSAPLYDFI